MEAPVAADDRPADPIAAAIARQGVIVLDGGLATELEALGCDLDDPLWSASALLERPDAVREVCRRYLRAGADCIATATYQASFEGLGARGLDQGAIESLLRDAVELAIEERDAFWRDLASPGGSDSSGRLRPLVAASVGPYGAMLADGSEYRGDYGLSVAELYDFHAPRWEVLAGTDADVIACETTPSFEETLACCRLAAVSGRPTWVSFQCRDAGSIADGTPLADVAAICEDEPNVVAVGVNCTDPDLVSDLIGAARTTTEKPLLVYPNSGETWNADGKRWEGEASGADLAERALRWRDRGARGIGGCCRVGPDHIAAIRASLLPSAEPA